jgi:hypothetical protein
MAQKTAVECLVDKVFGKNGLVLYAEVIEEAKEMELNQIVNAYLQNRRGNIVKCLKDWDKALDYYDKTYKK